MIYVRYCFMTLMERLGAKVRQGFQILYWKVNCFGIVPLFYVVILFDMYCFFKYGTNEDTIYINCILDDGMAERKLYNFECSILE